MLQTLSVLVLPLSQKGPAPEDVTAGWMGFVVFIGLVVAVALLGASLVKQLRKAQAAKDAGVYGDDPVADRPANESPEQPLDGNGSEPRAQA